MYYRGASAALLVYDLTAAASFGKIKEWVNELRLNVPEDIVMVVVGNKVDRADTHRQLSREQGEEYARSVGAAFAEVSAKTKEGIDEVFNEVAQKLVAARKAAQQRLEHGATTPQGAAAPGQGAQGTVDLQNKPADKEIDDSCCG